MIMGYYSILKENNCLGKCVLKCEKNMAKFAEKVMNINEDFEVLKNFDEQFCLEFSHINNKEDLKKFIKEHGDIYTIKNGYVIENEEGVLKPNEELRYKADEQTIMRLVKTIESVLVCKAYWSGSSGYSIKIFYNLLYLLLFKDFDLLDLEQSQYRINSFSECFKTEYKKEVVYFNVKNKFVKIPTNDRAFEVFKKAVINYTAEEGGEIIFKDDDEKKMYELCDNYDRFKEYNDLISLNAEKREVCNPGSNIIKDELRNLSRNFIKVRPDKDDMLDKYKVLENLVEKACEDFENKLKRNDLLESLTTDRINNKNYTNLTSAIFNDLKKLCKAVIDELMNDLIFYDRIRYVAKDGKLIYYCKLTMTKLMIDVYQNMDNLRICKRDNCNHVIALSGKYKVNKNKVYCSDSCSAQDRKKKNKK